MLQTRIFNDAMNPAADLEYIAACISKHDLETSRDIDILFPELESYAAKILMISNLVIWK